MLQQPDSTGCYASPKQPAGGLHTVETANWMVSQGHSSAKVKNLRGNIHNTLVEYEDFDKIAPNLFGYRPIYGKSDDSSRLRRNL